MLEEGKYYSFHTVTHYYVGKLQKLYPSHAIITDCVEMYETGELDGHYNKGKIKSFEKCPDGTMVPVGSGTTIFPWPTQKIPTAQGNG